MFCLFFIFQSLFFLSLTSSSTPFWPQPKEYSLSSNKILLDKNFKFIYQEKETFFFNSILSRYLSLLSSETNGELKECSIIINFYNENERSSKISINESYQIVINDKNECLIQSETVWGMLHGLESFTQLFLRDINDGSVYTTYSPLSIYDEPRFSHRGLLIDTSRHYLSIQSIERIIDSLSMNKFNILHWHMVDAQSFPVDIISSPLLIKGAYSPSHIYTLNDIQMLKLYAANRGVQLLPEIDVPGHAASWNAGYPNIMAKCIEKYSNINNYALDPTQDETYEVIKNVINDVIYATNVQYLHLGGDEVVYGW